MVHNMKWILVLIIFIGAILKFIFPESITDIVLFFGILDEPTATVFVYALATIEISCSILVGLNILGKTASKVLVAICLCYFLVGIIGYVENFEEVCGEFSKFNFGRFDIPMMVRNTVLLAISVTVYLNITKRVKMTTINLNT